MYRIRKAKMPSYKHEFNVSGVQCEITFTDKRTLNSFVKCLEKATNFTSNIDAVMNKHIQEKVELSTTVYQLEKQIEDLKNQIIEMKRTIEEQTPLTNDSTESFIIHPSGVGLISIPQVSEKKPEKISKIFQGWKIYDKNSHIALEPPSGTPRQEIEITPTYSQEWNPIIKGTYWNDGKYHFFPQNTKIHMKMTTEDVVEDMKKLGAESN
tara:strand:+ start:447 stop:1076 length:630 start_codon:yes stop_codon:yes gene_type:complete